MSLRLILRVYIVVYLHIFCGGTDLSLHYILLLKEMWILINYHFSRLLFVFQSWTIEWAVGHLYVNKQKFINWPSFRNTAGSSDTKLFLPPRLYQDERLVGCPCCLLSSSYWRFSPWTTTIVSALFFGKNKRAVWLGPHSFFLVLSFTFLFPPTSSVTNF